MTILVDTDVVIDFLRGQKEAVKFIQNNAKDLVLSVITHCELFAGARDGEESKILEAFLISLPVCSLTATIAKEAGLLKRRYQRSQGTGLGDAIIAASVLANKFVLATLNARHYPMITELTVPYRKKGAGGAA
jgi:hypothetical protein